MTRVNHVTHVWIRSVTSPFPHVSSLSHIKALPSISLFILNPFLVIFKSSAKSSQIQDFTGEFPSVLIVNPRVFPFFPFFFRFFRGFSTQSPILPRLSRLRRSKRRCASARRSAIALRRAEQWLRQAPQATRSKLQRHRSYLWGGRGCNSSHPPHFLTLPIDGPGNSPTKAWFRLGGV